MKHYLVKAMTKASYQEWLNGSEPRMYMTFVQADSRCEAETRMHLRHHEDYIAEGYTLRCAKVDEDNIKYIPPKKAWISWDE